MHNALAVLLSTFFFASSTSALYFPQFRLSLTPKPVHHDVSDKCTFTIWQKQLCTSSKKTNYIQLNEIEDRTNDITIDIAALRPAASHNSYARISEDESFVVKGLLNDKSLVIGTSDRKDDNVVFEADGVWFTGDGSRNSEDAWCDAGAWDVEDWQCGMGSRVSELRSC